MFPGVVTGDSGSRDRSSRRLTDSRNLPLREHPLGTNLNSRQNAPYARTLSLYGIPLALAESSRAVFANFPPRSPFRTRFDFTPAATSRPLRRGGTASDPRGDT